MEIREVPIGQLNPAAYNPRVDLAPGDEDYEKLRRSIEAFGYVDPVIWNERTGNVVGGHQRLKILMEAGRTDIPVSVVDLSEVDEKTLNIALNKISGDWDEEQLTELLKEISETDGADVTLSGFDESEIDELLGALEADAEEEASNPYATNVEIPHYEITGPCPALHDCYDTQKTDVLISEIEQSKVSKDEKEFLIHAARRHTVFNYRNIAEYYAHANAEMQDLMEKSALVIIDLNNAIANGYAMLRDDVLAMVDDEES